MKKFVGLGISALLLLTVMSLAGCGGGGGAGSGSGGVSSPGSNAFTGSYSGQFTSASYAGTINFSVDSAGSIKHGGLAFDNSSTAYDLNGNIDSNGNTDVSYVVNNVTYHVTGKLTLNGSTISGPVSVGSPNGTVQATLSAYKS